MCQVGEFGIAKIDFVFCVLFFDVSLIDDSSLFLKIYRDFGHLEEDRSSTTINKYDKYNEKNRAAIKTSE